jgi:hypothetical protein
VGVRGPTRRLRFFDCHGGIISQERLAVKEPENPTNPAHEKVGLGEEILTSQNEARQSRDRNPELPQKNTAQRSRNQIW